MISLTLVLYNIRSIHNVGSLFRTADGAGVSKILLVGYTPTPIDRFGRQRADMHKVALGAELTMPWEHYDTWQEAEKVLRTEGAVMIALEQDEKSIPYTEFSEKFPSLPEAGNTIALILGPEVEGLPKEIVDDVDVILEIPMMGNKESLNVAVAGGIVMYELLK